MKLTASSTTATTLRRQAAGRYDGLFDDTITYRSREDTVAQIHRLWTSAQEDFVRIGRWLNAAKAAMPHGEFEEMIATQLPFGAPRARQLRAVAAFVDSGLVPREQLPDHDTVVYEIATMEPDLLAEARRRALLRPNVTRRELKEFKKTVRLSLPPPPPQGSEAALRAEMDALDQQRRKIEARMAEIRSLLGQG